MPAKNRQNIIIPYVLKLNYVIELLLALSRLWIPKEVYLNTNVCYFHTRKQVYF